MSIDSALLDLMPHTVTLAPWVLTDAYNKHTYGTGVSRQALVWRGSKMIRDASGNERMSTAQVYLAGDYSTSPKDKITLPDSTTPPILRVDKLANEDGDYAEVIYV